MAVGSDLMSNALVGYAALKVEKPRIAGLFLAQTEKGQAHLPGPWEMFGGRE